MRSFSSIRFSAVLLMFWVTVMSPGQVRAQGESEVSESTLASILRKEAIAYENGEGVPRDLVLAARLWQGVYHQLPQNHPLTMRLSRPGTFLTS